jgi:hypothetical protein
MHIGKIIWELAFLVLIIFGALVVFWFRSGRKIENPRFWIRFSVVFLCLGLFAMIEGLLLSSYGFGWFIVIMALTVYLLKKIIPKLLGNIGINGNV